MEENEYHVYSISITRIVMGFIFLLIGAANVLLIDSDHQAGVLFPLPYWVTTGLPPALFGIGIFLHTLLTSFKFKIMQVKDEILWERKFILRKTQMIPINSIYSVKMGDTRNRFKYAIFGLWFLYVLFTLESGFHQLNDTYAAVLIFSGIAVFILSLLLLVCTRKEITLETDQGRIWAIITKINMVKLANVLQLPSFQAGESKKYKINDYKMLTIGILFIGLAFLIYFVLPFSTFIDIFLLIYGIKLVLSTLQNSWGTITEVKENSNLLIHTKGALRETVYFSKNDAELNPIRKFKVIHLFELAFIGFLFFQTIYSTVRNLFLADILYILQGTLVTALILISLVAIIFRLRTYLPTSGNKYIPHPIPHERPLHKAKKWEPKGDSGFFEDIVKFSQVKAFYYRLIFFFTALFLPLIVFTLGYPFLI